MPDPLKIGQVIDLFVPPAGNRRIQLARWPADVFAISLALLRRADAYTEVVAKWPPAGSGGPKKWTESMSALGGAWRETAAASSSAPPEVTRRWDLVLRAQANPVASIRRDRKLSEALLELIAAADEASAGAGVWDPLDSKVTSDQFTIRSMLQLIHRGTLGMAVDSSRAVVFPKMHTPQRGITSRSLTHHLSLHETREVEPRWFWFPQSDAPQGSFNLLVLPWPEVVRPREFRATEARLLNMPEEKYGFFTWDSPAVRVSTERVRSALRAAKNIVADVDAIAFPEMALADGTARRLCEQLGVIIIAGEGKPASNRTPGVNRAVVALPIGPRLALAYGQAKHHRWRIDAAQIQQYGLGSRLDPTRDWWEHIEIEPRVVNFWTIRDWLNFCVLICEDLARQDPVGELVRSVGPNLVISLLMDGPQLEKRWPAKYATVLADDPGSSVLTLTSLGMARLSRPPGKPESRVVGLWKDPSGPAVEIDLPTDASGAVLSLTRELREEHTADGRGDGGSSGYVRLNGFHPITLPR